MGPASPETVEADRSGRPDPLLDGLLTELKQRHWKPRGGDLLEVGDLEIQYAMGIRDGCYGIDKIERGARRTLARFSDEMAAFTYLILVLAEELRAHRGWPAIAHRRLAPRTQLSEEPEGQRLTWPGGWALFEFGRLGEISALPFSWAAQVGLDEIVKSYGNLNGHPLFNLGIANTRPWTDPAPRVSTLRPRPAETPPPEPDAGDEDALVAEAAAEVGWTPQPVEAADLLAVGQDEVGRVICYRHGAFQYQTFVRDQRSIIAAFTSAGAARRFLVMEIGAIWRLRQPGFRIIRVHRPGPGFTVTKGPTEFEVNWAGGTATFNLGYIAHQQALAFTWCAHGSLTDIAASYRDRNGAPLFDLEYEDQHRPPWHP